MTQFKDNRDRTWQIELTVASVKRVRDLAGLDLLSGETRSVVGRLITDPVLLCDAIYAAVKPAADAAGVTDEQFGASMAGDAIDDAVRAFLEELVNFTPNRRDRERMRRVIEAAWKMVDTTQDLLDEKLSPAVLDAAMANISREVIESLDRSLDGPTSSSSPEPSASTPAR